MFLGAFAIGFSHPAFAQNAVGGPTKPSSIGGVAKQSSISGAAKPRSVGGTPTQNPPTVAASKGGPIITSSTLKCAAGSCAAKGTKP